MELLLLRFRSWRERSRAVSVVVSWFMIVLKGVVVGGFGRMRFVDDDEAFVGADVDFCCWVVVEGVVVVVGEFSVDMINDAML